MVEPAEPIPPRSLPTRDVEFVVHVPDNTPGGEQVYLLLRPFIDWWWTEETHVPLTDLGEGVWSGTVSVPEGALIQYVYDRWDEQEWGEPFKAPREGADRGILIESRLLLVTPGLERVEDTVSLWNDLRPPSDDVATGKLTGTVADAATGEPVFDAEVVVAGMHSATLPDGTFEVPFVGAGPQRITVWRAEGDYWPVSVNVEVADGSTASVDVGLEPARPVAVTFDLLLPEETPEEAQVWLAGNVRQLGARQSGTGNYPYQSDGVAVPVLERIAPNRATVTLVLHEGTHLSYFYTISNGFAGRERLITGQDVFRQHLVGGANEVLADQVATWRQPGQSRITIRVLTPPNTPDGVPVISAGYWMTQVGDNEWVAYRYGWPGNTETVDLNLGGTGGNDAVATGADLVFGEDESEQIVTVERWGSLAQVSIPAPGADVTVPFRVSVPASTSDGAEVRVVFDNGTTFVLVPLSTNRWMYAAAVTLPGVREYAYRVERDGVGLGPQRTLVLSYDGQVVNDWVIAWSDESAEPINLDYIAGMYTPDFFSENFLDLSASTFESAARSNGSLVPVSPIWSYGHILPLPNVEVRQIESGCVCMPLPAIAEQAAFARAAGLEVFVAPQFNMEMTADREGLCCEHPQEWWDAWLIAAERLWLWNAHAATMVDADLLLLPGYFFHVFPGSGGFPSDESFAAFDADLIALMGRVREVYSGDVLVSGGVMDMELPGHADLVGVTTFDTGRPDLPASATAAEWAAAWEATFVEKVDPLWVRWGKPVFFYTVSPRAVSDDPLVSPEEVQAAELEGFFQVLVTRPWIAGTMSWAYQMVEVSGGEDTDGLRGRMAEAVLAKYYGAYKGGS